MKTITTDRAKELIRETNGQIFSSTFIKKNGQHRLLTGRLKVTKGLKKMQSLNHMSRANTTLYAFTI